MGSWDFDMSSDAFWQVFGIDGKNGNNAFWHALGTDGKNGNDLYYYRKRT